MYEVLEENGVKGYGLTKDDAKEDLFLNKCKADISFDTNEIYVGRKRELKPWKPRENMLHIHTAGCLCANGNRIVETSTGRTVEVSKNRQAIFYYLANLFGKRLTYTDIAISLQEDFNKFFQMVEEDLMPIQNFPEIKLMNSENGFEPTVTYTTKQNLIIGTSRKAIGVKEVGDEYFHVVELEDQDVSIELLSYICYRLGYLFNGKIIIEMEEE